MLMSLGLDWPRSLTHQHLVTVGAITLLVVLLAPDGVGAVLGRRGRRAGDSQEARS
jgi:hypothetical protein